jgi:hypothetical protein
MKFNQNTSESEKQFISVNNAMTSNFHNFHDESVAKQNRNGVSKMQPSFSPFTSKNTINFDFALMCYTHIIFCQITHCTSSFKDHTN